MVYLIIGVLILAVFLLGLRTKLIKTYYDVEIKTLPEEAHGLKIAHLSDFHDRYREGLFESVRDFAPDVIFITGDFMDYDTANDTAIALACELVKLAPVFYCPGNHEKEAKDFVSMMERLKDTGVCVLRDQSVYFKGMRIVGFDDVDRLQKKHRKSIFKCAVDRLQNDEFTVALFHHADLIPLFFDKNYNIVFSGHLHGGQMQFPCNIGLISPHFKPFPKFAGGFYTHNDQSFIVSKGLVFFPTFPRLYNPPELVFVTLSS